ncbi:hypothetical protein SAMN05443252_1053 [Bacillus sp. OV322]|nr:hypothetical protein SAMN05443252_1053 [Bacillus sp. OV322]
MYTRSGMTEPDEEIRQLSPFRSSITAVKLVPMVVGSSPPVRVGRRQADKRPATMLDFFVWKLSFTVVLIRN